MTSGEGSPPVVNVLLCNHQASDELVAGAEFVLLTIAGGVDPRRFRPFFLSNREGKVNELARAAGVETHRIPFALFGGFLFPNRKTGRRLARFAAAQEPAIREIAGFIERYRIGLVVANTIVNVTPLLAARRAGVPAVWFIHEIRYPFHCIDSRLRRMAARIAFRLRRTGSSGSPGTPPEDLLAFARRIVVLSEKAREKLAAPGAHRDRMVTRNPPLRPEIFAAARDGEAPAGRRGGAEELVVAYLGVVSRHKGTHDFVAAAARVARQRADVRFIVAGGAVDARYEAALRDRVRRLGLADRLTFTGFLPDPTPVYRQADVVCLVSWYDEPFGMVVTEAMAFGKTVVAYDTGAIREILRDGETGFIVRRGDRGALAERIVALARDRELGERIGANARRVALDRYNPAGYVRSIEELMAEAVADG